MGGGAWAAYSPPGVGDFDSAAGGLRLAAGFGAGAHADGDLPEPVDVGQLWRWRGADAGRVFHLA